MVVVDAVAATTRCRVGGGCRVVVVLVATVGAGRDGAGACGGRGDCIFYCFQKCLPCVNSGAPQCLIHFMGKMFFSIHG
jgi:hypothetical protein